MPSICFFVSPFPAAAHDQRTKWTYLFGAICPEHGKEAAWAMPFCNTEAMQWHLEEISSQVNPGPHGVIILDQAGWHTTKNLVVLKNITLPPLPPRSPELNPIENIWQFLRDNWLSNRARHSYEDTLDHCYFTWNSLTQQPWKLMSIDQRDWAHA